MTTSISIRRVGAVLLATMLAGCGRQAQVSSPAAGGGTPAPSTSISVNDGESLIRAMHARYNGRWPKMVTYTQTSTLIGQSGANNDQLMYVAIAPPNRQRIDYGNPDLGNGMLVRADSNYFFSNGRLVRSAIGWNDLLLLTHDVYNQSPDVTISVLRSLGFQMSRMQTKTFDTRAAYVIGATSTNDSTSRQFWVERDRLVLVRIREKRGDQFIDTRLGDFTRLGDAFMARQAYQFQNGIPRLHQQIAGIKADSLVQADLFEPKLWSTVKHWSKP